MRHPGPAYGIAFAVCPGTIVLPRPVLHKDDDSDHGR